MYEEKDKRFWGIGIESAADRIAWRRESNPYQWAALKLNFENAYIISIRSGAEYISRLTSKGEILNKKRPLLDMLAKRNFSDFAYSFNYRGLTMDYALEAFPHYRKTVELLLSGLED